MTRSVHVTDLCLRRPAFTLGPVSFTVPAGGRLAIVGPSGSGKTTLLRCLAGLEQPTAGTIAVGDTVVTGNGVHLPPDRRGVGLVFQDGALWPNMTALQHLQFAAPKLARADAQRLLERAGLGALAQRKPAAMSGGEAQRLGLLRALAPEPAALLLDEPLRSVDVHQRDALVLLVRALADERGLTTILVTHDRHEALALATDFVVLRDGRIVEQGPAERLLRAPSTAFTAAFLLGAACLPTQPAGAEVDTPFGRLPRPTLADGDLRLVLLPGEATAHAPGDGPNPAPAARGRVLQVLPGDGAIRLGVACGDQIVVASTAALLPVGSEVALTLTAPPRLLPWDRGAQASLGQETP